MSETSSKGAAPAYLASVAERYGRAAQRMPVQFGLPLVQGQYFQHGELALIDGQGDEIPASISATSLWPDNSIQWCLIRAQVDLQAKETLRLGLKRRDPLSKEDAGAAVRVEEDDRYLYVHTASRSFRVDTRTLRLLDLHDTDEPSDNALGFVHLSVDKKSTPGTIHDVEHRTLLSARGALCIDIKLRGSFDPGDRQRIAFRCALRIAASGERVDASIMLHNPAAARHPEGLWDLGDANSAFFGSLQLGLQWQDDSLFGGGVLRTEHSQSPQTFAQQGAIRQLASGGERWQSPVHVNAEGEVTLTEPGYQVRLDDQELRGSRANPAIQITQGKIRCSAHIAEFWQRFPSQLRASPGELALALLPETQEAHELQAGERCTHRFSFSFEDAHASPGQEPASFPEPLLRVNSDYVRACALPELGDPDQCDPEVQALIDEGLDGEQNFFWKREAIDEYGWRHFGDLWADHETEGYRGERLFVSHYNNQYDPLFGFLRQYLNNGDPRWFDLANALARHTVDIDMYHTQEDRPEYNFGLFWHTDHYLQAETSSHRSYSRRQPKDAYDGHSHGGGPGGQHCYTTGLLYHYFLTGDEDSREALYELRSWITRVYEGSGTLTDVALAVKNRDRVDLKNHLTGQYPLDRGIANYLQALMDCYALDRIPSTLTQASWIIQHTVHPTDDIAQRELHDIEKHWFYVVFLQALCRFIDIKVSNGEIDYDFCYARDSLLHYARWMLNNEAPYLQTPDILEFPNHTWTAQDLRKVNVLFSAARWHPADGSPYDEKARELLSYITTKLSAQPDRQYTRILALLMQNLHPSAPLPEAARASAAHDLPAVAWHAEPAGAGAWVQIRNLLRLVFHAVRHLQLNREVAAVRRLLPSRTTDENAL